MVFVKNPERGKVKTRLASSVGKDNALKVYQHLLSYTNKLAGEISAEKAVFYSAFVDDLDIWSNFTFNKFLQEGNDLGEKMANGFQRSFKDGYQKVVIIGSDCYELTSEIIEDAFEKLDHADIVIGPALDGGYYLLGMNKFVPELFQNKRWSTENVLLDTMLDLSKLELTHFLLPTLSDIDHMEDLGELKGIIEGDI